jgi:hypothetical protein
MALGVSICLQSTNMEHVKFADTNQEDCKQNTAYDVGEFSFPPPSSEEAVVI